MYSLAVKRIPMSQVRLITEQHKANHTLVKVIESTYRDVEELSDPTLSVTYRYEEEVGTIVMVYGSELSPSPIGDDLIELYREHSAMCQVHEAIIVTTTQCYIATYVN